MANTYKNIVITPNRDTLGNVVPVIQFSGGDVTTNTDINLRVYTTSNGTLSFEGSAGQLFSITNDMTNSIFSVNDVSGIPSIDVYANGNIYLAPFGGRVGLGITPSTLPTSNLHVAGSLFVTQNNSSSLDVTGEIAEFAHHANSYTQVHIRNANTGQGASGDLVVTADTGTDSVDFIDLGINSSGFSSPGWTINGTRDGYLYASNGNLAIGVANVSRIVSFFTGGTLSTHERMRIDQSGDVGIGTTNPTANLHVSGNFFVSQNNTSSLDVVGEIAEFASDANNYAQIHVRNANTQQGASGDLVVTADTGTDVLDFIDLGINNSNYSQPTWTINGTRDGYLYTSHGNLSIGTANVLRSVTFFTGGTLAANERLRIDPSGNVLIGRANSTVGFNIKLDVAGGINAATMNLSTALPAVSGGTGQSTYVVGDILYASSTSALTRLAGVAVGSALISGGVGAAPSWGRPYGVLLRAPQVLTAASGTYTTPASCTGIYAELIGGGAAGGGIALGTVTTGAPGGGAGAYCAVYATVSPSTGYAYTVGAGGAGVSAAAGGNGGNTTLTIGATVYRANGGTGGAQAGGTLNGGVGGLAAAGTLNVGGGGGQGGAGIALSGMGGASYLGGGAQSVSGASAGAAATANGAGGSGASSAAAGASRAGGNGAGGIIRIWEFG